MMVLGHRDLSGGVIAAAIEVHRVLGPGFEDGFLLNFASMPLTIQRVGREPNKGEN